MSSDFPYHQDLKRLKSIFNNSDFVLFGHPLHKLRMKIDYLKASQGNFFPRFLPIANEQGQAILSIIKTSDDLASLIGVYCNETWFKELIAQVLRGKVKLKGGRQEASWAREFDIIGAFLWLKHIGFKSSDISQFIAESLKVPGFDQMKSGIREGQVKSQGADSVDKYIQNHKSQWYSSYFPEHSNQSELVRTNNDSVHSSP